MKDHAVEFWRHRFNFELRMSEYYRERWEEAGELIEALLFPHSSKAELCRRMVAAVRAGLVAGRPAVDTLCDLDFLTMFPAIGNTLNETS